MLRPLIGESCRRVALGPEPPGGRLREERRCPPRGWRGGPMPPRPRWTRKRRVEAPPRSAEIRRAIEGVAARSRPSDTVIHNDYCDVRSGESRLGQSIGYTKRSIHVLPWAVTGIWRELGIQRHDPNRTVHSCPRSALTRPPG